MHNKRIQTMRTRTSVLMVTDANFCLLKEGAVLRHMSQNILWWAESANVLCWCCRVATSVAAHRMDSVLTVLMTRTASVAGRWSSSTRVLALSSVSLHRTRFFSCSSLSHVSLFCFFSSNFLISFSLFLRAERWLRLHTPRAWQGETPGQISVSGD